MTFISEISAQVGLLQTKEVKLEETHDNLK